MQSYRKVANAVVPPTRGRINQSGRVQLQCSGCQSSFGERSVIDLAPALVVDDLVVRVSIDDKMDYWWYQTYPGVNTRVRLVLLDEDIKLPFKLGLLRSIGEDIIRILGIETRHVLDQQDAQLIACTVEQSWLDFDLSYEFSD